MVNRKISGSSEFQATTKLDAAAVLSSELIKLIGSVDPSERRQVECDLQSFKLLFGQYIEETHSSVSINWDLIESPPPEAIIDYDELTSPTVDTIASYLSKLVVVKLNGGLGTSMGCVGPKSLIDVRNGLTFLDLTVQSIERLNKRYNVDVPLVLMNSFNTDDDTEKVVRKYRGFKVRIYTFLQSRFPRLNKETLLPVATTIDGDNEDWYPPGHGDFYQSFAKSGLLSNFLSQGN